VQLARDREESAVRGDWNLQDWKMTDWNLEHYNADDTVNN